jgi:hypothetical protein
MGISSPITCYFQGGFMAMFDYVKCAYPLPGASPEINAQVFQTKDLKCRLDELEIRGDGSLWVEDYDTEDQSGLMSNGQKHPYKVSTRVNPRARALTDFTGTLRMCANYGPEALASCCKGWVVLSARFEAGQLRDVSVLEDRPPVEYKDVIQK